MKRLRDRICIVTGAARGIGKGIAKRFLEEGAAIWICDLDGVALRETVTELSELGQVEGSTTDVTDRDGVQRMIDDVVDRWGRLDVLVNNAGIARTTPLLQIDDDEWRRVVETNLFGTFLCLQISARQMAKQGTGSAIVNIASTNGLRGQPLLAHYGASKAGIVNLTQTAALELGIHQVRVNAICPATTWTALSASVGWPDDVWADLRSHSALGRLGSIDDVAGAAVYLASEDASFITGTALVVDGGLLARQIVIDPERLRAPSAPVSSHSDNSKPVE